MTNTFRRHFGSPILTLISMIVLVFAVPSSHVILLGSFMAFVTLLIGLDLMLGDTGLLAMGHSAFFGVGAYISSVLWGHWHWSMYYAAPTAILSAAFLALLIGYPAASRTTGLYFALITFAFGQILVVVVDQTTVISGGSEGLAVNFGVGSTFPFGWDTYRFFTAVMGVILTVVVLAAGLIRTSHFGLRLRAVKSSENLTRGLGFNPTVYKTAIFVIGSSMAALAGVAFAPLVGFIHPSLMNVQQSVYLLGLLFVGGMMRVSGAFVGVALLATLPQLVNVQSTARYVIVGLAMAVVVLGAPGEGVVGVALRLIARARRRSKPTFVEVGNNDKGEMNAL